MELVISNVVDAYRENIALIQDPAMKEHEIWDSFYVEERALLWAGDSKLVITSLPVPAAHVDYLRRVMGYSYLENLSPRQPSDSLCEDMLRERDLFDAVVARLRGKGEVRLITFVAQRQVLAVADALRAAGVRVSLAECPRPENMWTQAYLDSKAGFRRFYTEVQSRIPGLRIPDGAVARNTAEAASLADRFLRRGRSVICKPNNSQGGVGFLKVRPGEIAGTAVQRQREIQRRLDADPAMASDVIVVEELVDMDTSVGGGTPSIEMRVPAEPERDVEFMYLCGQMLTPSGYFFGADMHADVVDPARQQAIEAAGVAVAREIRRLGYVGIFDMDLVAATDGQMYAVEVNTRRTGCTHAHEAAEAILGPRYWERGAVICNNVLTHEGEPFSYEELAHLLGGLLFPMEGRKEGILLSIVSSLPSRRVGYVALGPSIGRVRELCGLLQGRLAAAGRPPLADFCEPETAAAVAQPIALPVATSVGGGE